MKHLLIREIVEILWDITDLILGLVEDTRCACSELDLTPEIRSKRRGKCCSLQVFASSACS